MRIDEVAHCAEHLDGVRRSDRRGLAEWRYHGRLVARQLDAEQIVIRAEFDFPDTLVSQHPETFIVPARFAEHMMIVAELRDGGRPAIEDAIDAAWQLQRRAD